MQVKLNWITLHFCYIQIYEYVLLLKVLNIQAILNVMPPAISERKEKKKKKKQLSMILSTSIPLGIHILSKF